ncbi:hypothetical protein [Angustibacter aerolatus]|uniref:ATP/GTP-binding protein n=1 Tax=Angustibacter aerolatus TaxID=1162965 RepID=A0ABQ6JKA5_9ACTN|nr:hypothetical protein [Angustibacter aerolatus]GMA88648.1 hypothetical protein GCM10025868_38980 [Angustibacter aerolatus]
MPRANRRRDEAPRPLGGQGRVPERRERLADGEWFVREVAGAPGREYRCPGCEGVVPAGTAHVVAWPADGPWSAAGAVDVRRHWHRHCWAARSRR